MISQILIDCFWKQRGKVLTLMLEGGQIGVMSQILMTGGVNYQ